MTERTLRVRDILGSEAHVSRTHVLCDNTGRETSYVFAPGQHVDLPYDVAMRLIPIDGFEVLDPKTNRRIVLDSARGQLAKIDLKPDEVVANLEELTRDALLARAKRLPGGDKLAPSITKTDLATFIMTGGAPAADDGAAEPDGVGGAIVVDGAP